MMNLLDITEALHYGESENRLFSEAREPSRWGGIRENPFFQKSLDVLREYGKKYLHTPIRVLPFSKYKIFDTTGSRKEYEAEFFEHRGRLNTFALLSLIYEEPAYIEALEDTIWATCDEFSWCLPAHLGGHTLDIVENPSWRANPDKNVLPREHDKMVDLFAAETAFALSEICDLLSHKLAPIVVHRARKLVVERVLEPYIHMNPMFFWETSKHNWAAVCAGSIGAAALYLIRDSNVLAPVILRVLQTMEAFLSGYADDGACLEGLGYWNYGFGFYIVFAELLRQRTMGKIDGFTIPKVKRIALFQQKCYLSGHKTISFSDGKPEVKFLPGLTSLLKRKFTEVEYPDADCRANFSEDPCYRWAFDVRNFVWSDPGMKGGMMKPVTYYLPDAKWVISHAVNGEGSCSFVAKGGHNDEPHNHNDIGSFIFQIADEQVLVDLGAGEYTKQYFGPQRYTYFCNGSQGHSVPIVEGCYQQAGKEFYATVLEQISSDERDIFAIDMTKAYAVSNLVSLKRRWEFQKTPDVKLILRDEYQFSGKPNSIIERFISYIEPKYIAPGRIQYQGTAGTVTATYDPAIMDFSVHEETYSNHSAEKVKVYCLDLCVKAESDLVSAEVVFSVGNGE